MRFKATIPYVIIGLSSMLTGAKSTAQTIEMPQIPQIKIEVPAFDMGKLAISKMAPVYDVRFEFAQTQNLLANKASALCEAFTEKMLGAQAKLEPLLGTHGYSKAVRRELPGAPVGKHCLYGQYTHLKNALAAQGDTLTIIPQMARAACIQFKTQMRRKYNGYEYEGSIHEGKMYETDSAYNVAQNAYLARRKITETSPDSVRIAAMADFAKKNFSADELESGAILIVPRFRGSTSKFHAIMYVGRGRIEKGQFIADPNGKHIYAGHNREKIGDLFGTYDTSNVFAADTKKIAQVEYGKEFARIRSMERDALVEYLARHGRTVTPAMSREELLRIAREVYFNINVPRDNLPPSNAVAMYDNARKMPLAIARANMQHTI